MKKLKEKRLFIALISLLTICLCVISFVMIKYFVGSSESKYGSRLEGISKLVISDKKIKDTKETIGENELVEKVDINIIGKIIYMTFTFKEKTTLVEAQSVAITSLDSFSTEESAYYDFQFSLIKEKSEKEEGFNIMGSKNIASGLINWNNNTKVEEEE